MAANHEMIIPIDDFFTQPVCNYSVGFLRFKRDGKTETAAPAGTGTFAKLGKVYGILTAGHVLQPMGINEVVGLVRFPGVQPPLQNFRLNLSHTERIVMWNGKDCDAPDIAFLKFPRSMAEISKPRAPCFITSESHGSSRLASPSIA